MSFIPKPPFPNVPKLPGVPQLLRSNLSIASPGPIIGAAAAIGALWRALFTKPKWGVFKQPPPTQPDPTGIETVTVVAELRPVVECDSVLDFGYRNEVDIPDFPIQDGAFANYNRVNLAYEASVRFAKGGSESDRAKFLDQINTLMNSTDLYQIITPERTYTNVNPVRFELIRRGASGAYQITEADLYFREIRTVTPQYTTTATTTQNAKNVSAQPVQNRGTVNGDRPLVEPTITGVVNE